MNTVKLLFWHWLVALAVIFVFRALIPIVFFSSIGDRDNLGHAIDNAQWWLCNNNGHLMILFFTNVLLFFSTVFILLSHPTPFARILQPFYGLINSIIESVKFLGFLLIGKKAEIEKIVVDPKSGEYALRYLKALAFGNILLIGYFFVAMSDEVTHFAERFHENKKKREPEKKEGEGEKGEGGVTKSFVISTMAFVEAAGQTISFILKHKPHFGGHQ